MAWPTSFCLIYGHLSVVCKLFCFGTLKMQIASGKVNNNIRLGTICHTRCYLYFSIKTSLIIKKTFHFFWKKREFKTCSTKENHLHYFLFTTKTSKQVCHGPIGGNPKGLTFIWLIVLEKWPPTRENLRQTFLLLDSSVCIMYRRLFTVWC